MSNNNHISDCGFAAEIPDHLYGEIGERENSGFENHLENCPTCADALAASSFALFSVREWRDAEFAQMKTPVINIPYERKPERKNVISVVSDSWLARLRQYVSLSPAWAAGGGMAVLAIGFGLIFAAVNMFQPVEFAEVNYSAKTAVSPTIQNNAPKSEKSSGQSPEPPIKNVEAIQSDVARQNNRTNPIEVQKINVPKVSHNTAANKIVKRNSENASTNNRLTAETSGKSAASRSTKVPALTNFEEEEDKSLRLAELFEDTGAK